MVLHIAILCYTQDGNLTDPKPNSTLNLMDPKPSLTLTPNPNS